MDDTFAVFCFKYFLPSVLLSLIFGKFEILDSGYVCMRIGYVTGCIRVVKVYLKSVILVCVCSI